MRGREGGGRKIASKSNTKKWSCHVNKDGFIELLNHKRKNKPTSYDNRSLHEFPDINFRDPLQSLDDWKFLHDKVHVLRSGVFSPFIAKIFFPFVYMKGSMCFVCNSYKTEQSQLHMTTDTRTPHLRFMRLT